ncbi:AraC family transcriptional regulator [Vibrio sp. Y2-5]|uniref:helix-turn-helix domain-containing protein n=1 Tax=Vibrio sp. Y2-5 TaxID=2743977 RepID=UPI001660C756|nr:AraC family transcriptional regulator [Vibrio sp. Y2-5]MBD0787354.1 AraC family transcriptional regulator [Vibrio sp. Y2-5]
MLSSLHSYQVANIHSKQPWFVLSAEKYATNLTTENPVISHFYSFEVGKSQTPTTAIPDGCVDLLFDCDSDSPVGLVCGTTLEATEVAFNQNHRYFGMRFVPGFIPDFIEISAPELTNKQCNIVDVVMNSQDLVEQIVSASSFQEQVQIAKQFMQGKQGRKPTNLTHQVAAKICHEKGNIQVQDLEAFTGYCSRTLQRQFRADLGLTPKAFCRAIRCQSAIYDINHLDKIAFSDLAFNLGFSDQSHFLREFKKLVSATPLEYQNRVKQKTYLDRIQCY